jgi:hypothetical protein
MQYDFPNSQRVDRIGRGVFRKELLRKSPAFRGKEAIPYFRYLQKRDYFADSRNESFRASYEYFNYEKKYSLR